MRRVNAGKHGRLRQYGIWLRLLGKRLWRQPAYLILLALIPLLGWGVGQLEQGGREGVRVAVCVEAGAWSDAIEEGLRTAAADSILVFDAYESGAEVERSVIRGEADSGFVLAEDIGDRVMRGELAKCITLYETPASSITGMAQERISGVLFQLYAAQRYEAYMRETAHGLAEEQGAKQGMAGQTEEGMDDVTPQESEEDFVAYAMEAYERHLVDGSTFGFQYVYGDHSGQYNSDSGVSSDTVVFPVKGVFAVIIFMSGMCGMLEYDTDRREKRFLRLAPRALTYIVDVWMPTVFVSASVLLCLWLRDGMRYGSLLSVWRAGMWGREMAHLLLYQGIVVGYCCLLGIALRRQETIAAAMPVLALGSLVCTPVFIRLGSYLPVFAVLEKLFPPTYYLLL